MGFIWLERGSGELHVNLRGYPGRTKVPTCARRVVGGKRHATKVPCFADPHGTKRSAAPTSTVYTGNQDADQWHVLYAWRHDGSLYTLSQHVAAPLTYRRSSPTSTGCCASLVWSSPAVTGDAPDATKELLAGAAAGALGAAGVYELVDQLDRRSPRAAAGARPAARAAPARRRPGRERQRRRGASSRRSTTSSSPRSSRSRTGGALRRRAARARARARRAGGAASSRRPPGSGSRSPGACRTSQRYVPRLAGGTSRRPPRDRRARASRCACCSARAASRATRTRRSSRQNDVAVLLRSDALDHIADGAKAIFGELELFEVTSIRKGFAGGGFDGGRACRSRWRWRPSVPGADLIPDTAELFLGFTSTQKAGLGPERIANLETLGLRRPPGYFATGRHARLAHRRGPRGLVPQLRPRGAGRHGLPAGPEVSRGR